MLIASMGVSFFPAGERLLRAAATKEMDPGINLEPLEPVWLDALDKRKT
jgi:hypothetical protein